MVLIRIYQFQARQKTPDKQNKKNDILKIMKILIRVSGEGGGIAYRSITSYYIDQIFNMVPKKLEGLTYFFICKFKKYCLFAARKKCVGGGGGCATCLSLNQHIFRIKHIIRVTNRWPFKNDFFT